MKRSGSVATDQAWRAIGNLNWIARTMDGTLAQAERGLNASIEMTRNDQTTNRVSFGCHVGYVARPVPK